MKRHFEKLQSKLAHIHIVDKLLILFMAVLLLQSAYTLFFYEKLNDEGVGIDIIVRTSSASIFGYFLSVNFIKSSNKADLALEKVDSEMPVGVGIPTQPPIENRSQITAAAVVGLFCLIILLALRNIPSFMPSSEISSSLHATVGQFRDFVSGCVGFLIGSPTHSRNTK